MDIKINKLIMVEKKKEFFEKFGEDCQIWKYKEDHDPEPDQVCQHDDYCVCKHRLNVLFSWLEAEFTSQREEFVKDLEEAFKLGKIVNGEVFGYSEKDEAYRKFFKLISKYKKNEKV